MKKCMRCGEVKPRDDFNKKSSAPDGLQRECKECNKTNLHEDYIKKSKAYVERSQRNTLRRYTLFVAWKNTLKCFKCGESDHATLEFHHTDHTQKEHTISVVVRGSLNKCINELNKCVCLCANCHRKAHAYDHAYSPQLLGQNFQKFIGAKSKGSDTTL